MNLEELIVRLRIEEDNKGFKKEGSILLLLRKMWWSMDKAPRTRKLRPRPSQSYDLKEVFPRINFKENVSIVAR